jgi:hypothetical protein
MLHQVEGVEDRGSSGLMFNEHIAEDGPTVFAHACRLGAEGIVSKRVDGTLSIRSVPRLDQGPQSRQRRCAAGAERDLESTSRRQHPLGFGPPPY